MTVGNEFTGVAKQFAPDSHLKSFIIFAFCPYSVPTTLNVKQRSAIIEYTRGPLVTLITIEPT